MNRLRNARLTWEWLKLPILMAVLAVSFLACGGGGGVGPRVTTTLHVPELDRSAYVDANFKEGWEHLKRGKADAALKSFEMSDVQDHRIYVAFGYAFLARGKYNLSRKNFERALAMAPDNMQAQMGLATMFERLGNDREAFSYYSRLRVQYPENAWVKVRYDSVKTRETELYLKRAEEYKNADHMDAYVSALETAAQYSPELVEIKIKIADYFYGRDEFDRAVRQYEKALETVPHNEDILMKLAGIYEATDKTEDALMTYRKIQEFKPGDAFIREKIEHLNNKLRELKLPPRFKNIYFKEELNREELAALIGYYFEDYLEPGPPVIVTDIAGSFAREYIIKICALNIMNLRPDHSFGRFGKINRVTFAVVVHALIKYLERSGEGRYKMNFTPLDNAVEPADISPLHKYHDIIKYLVNSQVMPLDETGNFNPTLVVSPQNALEAIRKIRYGISTIRR